MSSNNSKKIILGVTAPESVSFFKGNITYLREAGFEVIIVCSKGSINLEGAVYYPIEISREISLFKDIKSLWQLFRLFKKIKPDIINYGTPKAGLLMGIASRLANISKRVYTSHGLRLETLGGTKKRILLLAEKIACYCSNKVLCVSQSLRELIIENKIASKEKTIVLDRGSIKGVDTELFNVDERTIRFVKEFKEAHNVPTDAIVLGFVGRFTRDKGIHELIESFKLLSGKFPNIYLIMCGRFEEGDPVHESVKEYILSNDKIIKPGHIEDVIPYYQVMDIFVFPSYREGLPTVLLEAGAANLPVISSEATGCIDVIIHEENGYLVPKRDIDALVSHVEKLILDKNLRESLGANGRKRVELFYNPQTVWESQKNLYLGLLAEGS